MAAPTYNLTGGAAKAAFTGVNLSVIEAVLDLAKHPVGNGESAAIIAIPAQSCVLEVSHQVLTVEGAVLTAGIGDSASATAFGTAVDLNVLAHAGAVLANPKYYPAADDIRLTMNQAGANAAKVLVKAVIVGMATQGKYS